MAAVPGNRPRCEGCCGPFTRPRMAPHGVGKCWLPIVPLWLMSSESCGQMAPGSLAKCAMSSWGCGGVCWDPVPAYGEESVSGPCSHCGDGAPAPGARWPRVRPDSWEPGGGVTGAEMSERGGDRAGRRGVSGEQRRCGRCVGAVGLQGRWHVDACEAGARAKL